MYRMKDIIRAISSISLHVFFYITAACFYQKAKSSLIQRLNLRQPIITSHIYLNKSDTSVTFTTTY